MTILTEQDITNTYNKKQQEQSKLYLQYQEIKKQNPEIGYKKISKILQKPAHKTRWWHAKRYIPFPIQTINWLKQRNLLPLIENNTKLPSIAKILGTTFGDGGIFKNSNGIFLSSSELESVKEFKENINQIFGKEIDSNSRIIEGGEYGHSYCYQNTNRNIIRFFQAVGAPIGRKSEIEINIPEWILANINLQDCFFASFFGNEIGIPKIHKDKRRTDSLDIGLVCKKELLQNRINFLNNIQEYLKIKGVKAEKIYTRQHKQGINKLLMKLAINLNFDNLMNFYKNIRISYSQQKAQKLQNTLTELQQLKLKRFNKISNTINVLTKRNYSKEWIKKNLRLTDKSLTFILNQEPLEKWN
ncbi:hypothetical protein HYX19_02585 [Candidatus Woesearchaeota archaeon]|nr:hypothetical protein [Candidatus Woesearchaeota archaeon]